ncbi:MAG TPA: hypothetical protein H9671_02455 [Firmicutes bacterium]|nr:hypothetical protein [Bacillota bacterium]
MAETEKQALPVTTMQEADIRSHNGKVRRRSDRAVILGGTVFAFAVFGLVMFLVLVVRGIGILTDDTDFKERMENFIQPLVMLDLAPFNDAATLDNATILTASIWDIILHENRADYPLEDGMYVCVPQEVIEAHVVHLFGPDVLYQHSTVGDAELTFRYDAEKKYYQIPLMIEYISYSPKIYEVEWQNDQLLLTVGYLPRTIWGSGMSSDQAVMEPVKFMEYELRKNGQDYVIVSVSPASREYQPGYMDL